MSISLKENGHFGRKKIKKAEHLAGIGKLFPRKNGWWTREGMPLHQQPQRGMCVPPSPTVARSPANTSQWGKVQKRWPSQEGKKEEAVDTIAA